MNTRKEKIRPRLTKRQEEVMALILEQFSNKQIADKLNISMRTVEEHRKNIMNIMGAKNFVGAVNFYQNNVREKLAQKDKLLNDFFELAHKVQANIVNVLNEAGSWREALSSHKLEKTL